MKTSALYNDILTILSQFKDNDKMLLKVFSFLEDQLLITKSSKLHPDIPQKYYETVLQIATAIDSGFICYLNPQTLEIEQVQKKAMLDAEEIEEQQDDMLDEFALNYMKWERFIEFTPFERDEILDMMENFANQLNDEKMNTELEYVLQGDKPLTDFQRIVDNSEYEDAWHEFRKQATINYVQDILVTELGLK